MSTLEVNTVKPISGSNTITLGESGDTIALASGASQTLAVNTPAFRAQLSSAQSISDATYVKVQVDSEDFDTDNCYDNSSNYRVTPNVAGKYFVYAGIASYGGATDSLLETNPRIRKNGSNVVGASTSFVSASKFHVATEYMSVVVTMNGSSDYVELFQYADSTSSPNVQASGLTYFGAYRLVGA